MLYVRRRRCATVTFVSVCFSLGLVMNYLHQQPSEENVDTHGLSRDYVLSQKRRHLGGNSHRAVGTGHRRTTRWPARATINIYRGDKIKPLRTDTHVVQLKTLAGKTPIVVYKPEVDNMISAYVKDYGTWEEDMLNQTAQFLKSGSDLVFLDIGCNIGVYSLFVAKLGVAVIAVDAVEDNVRLVTESAKLGNLTQNIGIIFNAISDSHKTVSMRIPPENVGGAHIDDVINGNGDVAHSVQTITLDDLIPILKGKSVFVKMDIEGSEARAISAAHDFFQTVDVRGVLMEWVHHRRHPSGQGIIDTLLHNGLFPYTDISRSEILDPDRYYTWPENVFWLKR